MRLPRPRDSLARRLRGRPNFYRGRRSSRQHDDKAASGDGGTAKSDRRWETMKRYEVKRGSNGWIVWDMVTRRVAVVDHSPAVLLSAETAALIATRLNKTRPRVREKERQH